MMRNRMLPVMQADELKVLYRGKWGVRCEIWTSNRTKVDFDITLEKEEGRKLFNILVEAAKRVENE